MCISGTEPSPVILSQTKLFKKMKSDDPKVSNKLKPKGMMKLLSNDNDSFNIPGISHKRKLW